MRVDIEIQKYNELFIRVGAEKSIQLELSDHFSYYADGYKFMPTYKSGRWDGKIRLFDIRYGTLYGGLVPDLIAFCNKYSYTYSLDPQLSPPANSDELKKFIKTIPTISSLEPYPYQLAAVVAALLETKTLILSPTGSGKSLIIYLIVKYLMENIEDDILIVVPTTSLVEQAVKDFSEYDITGTIQNNCHKLYSGFDKITTKKIVISTWQSIFKLPKIWFEKFGAVILDEAHQANAQSITGILHKMDHAIYRTGLTGTLNGARTHELFMRGIFGKLVKTSSTKKLMDEGKLAELNIKVVRLEYPDSDRKIVKSLKYQDEISFLVNHQTRNNLLIEMGMSQNGNTLLLFNFVETHGKKLFDMASDLAAEKGKQVFFIHGGVPVKERERMRDLMEKNNNIVILASYGTFSTGVNVKNIQIIIFGHPYKGRIRNLQSIGRGLRIYSGKTSVTLIDLCDDLTYKSKQNMVLKHSIQRLKIYESERFRYSITNLPLN